MSKRSKAHTKHVRACRCGRVIRGNAYTAHVRACPVFLAFYLDYSPDVLRRHGIPFKVS